MPLDVPMVALALDTDQVPPPVMFTNVISSPSHTCDGPHIEAGVASTVSIMVTRQVLGAVYVIIVVPAVDPVIYPVEDVIDAFELLAAHVPPVGVLLSVVD